MLESTHLASDTRADDFHEIQLNGKQLLFAVMATMVASAAIFLLGVIVGRNFERGRTSRASSVAMVDEVRRDPAVAERPPTVVEPGYDPTKAPPPTPPAADRESRIASAAAGSPPPVMAAPAKEGAPAGSPAASASPPGAARPAAGPNVAASDKQAASADKPGSGSAAVPTGTTGNAVAAKSAPSAATVKSAAASGGIPVPDDPKQGWLVQVAATATRDEAESIVRRLTGKGYPAFIVSSSSNVFRVRVGGYKARRDAETVAAKLRAEERISPWITR